MGAGALPYVARTSCGAPQGVGLAVEDASAEAGPVGGSDLVAEGVALFLA